MSATDANELTDILERVKTWSTPLRITLARRILETLDDQPIVQEPPRRKSLKQILGMLKTDTPPPTDEECERIVEEERMRKYG
jgi:hypothetical protein